MLRTSEVAQVRSRVAQAEKDLGRAQTDLIEQCSQLHSLRSDVGRALVGDFEAFVNTLASSPKEYDRTLEAYHLNLSNFDAAGRLMGDAIAQEIRQTAVLGSSTAGAGVAVGAATAFGAPTAAMAVATTFGTASTGTAISALSGAAATKAAIAWLGGGALAAGGGGMAAGNALLALAGPVGLALAGTALVGGVVYVGVKNRSTIEKGTALAEELMQANSSVRAHLSDVCELYALTSEHTSSLRNLLQSFTVDAPKDYNDFSPRQKEVLGAMHNNVLALCRLLKLKPGEAADLTMPIGEDEPMVMSKDVDEAPYKPNFVIPSDEPAIAPISVASILKKSSPGVFGAAP